MLFRARQFEFRFPRPALVMGVVNVTPDSFSDGGKFLDAEAAVAHGLALVAQGAEILDIGGESTRPGAVPVDEKEELRRVIPVIEKLSAEINARWGERPREPLAMDDRQLSQAAREDARPTNPPLISVDTMKPAVARAALAAGASIVNDVTAVTRTDFTMWKIVAEHHAGYIVMHTQDAPATMQENPVYKDVVRDINGIFSERLGLMLNEVGVPMEQLALDVGIGFGKTLEHNLSLLAGLRSFTKWKRPLVLGVSRKSFIEKLLGAKVENRLPASLACTTLALDIGGAQIIRTHDVAETVSAVRMAEAILSRKPNVD